MWTLISTPLINGALISTTLISIISVRNSWYTFDILDVYLRNRSILSRWRSTSNNETVKNPRSGQISLVDPLHTLRESTTKKVSISDYMFIFVSVVSASFVSLWMSHIKGHSFIMKCYPSLLQINFLYLKVVFH